MAKPEREEFDTDEEYEKALEDWYRDDEEHESKKPRFFASNGKIYKVSDKNIRLRYR